MAEVGKVEKCNDFASRASLFLPRHHNSREMQSHPEKEIIEEDTGKITHILTCSVEHGC